jgi:hypothetical protein
MGPRPKLADETEVSAMLEKLARRAKTTVQVSQEPPEMKSRPPLLQWLKPERSSDGSVHVASACGRFRIERNETNGKRTYFAMTFAPEFRHEIGRGNSADEAKAICETEARRATARESVSDARCGDRPGEKGS